MSRRHGPCQSTNTKYFGNAQTRKAGKAIGTCWQTSEHTSSATQCHKVSGCQSKAVCGCFGPCFLRVNGTGQLETKNKNITRLPVKVSAAAAAENVTTLATQPLKVPHFRKLPSKGTEICKANKKRPHTHDVVFFCEKIQQRNYLFESAKLLLLPAISITKHLFSKLNGGPFSWQFQMAGKGWQPRLAPNTHVTCPSSEQTQPSIGRYYVISLALNANMQWIGTVLAKIRTICGKIATFAAHQRRKGRKPARKAKGEVGRCGERAVPRNWEIRSEEYVWRCWRWWCCWCCW